MTKQKKPRETAGPLHAPVGDVLARVAHELRHLSERLGQVESLVGPLILEVARRDGDLLRRIQDLDGVRQKVGSLADFLAALAAVAPEACFIDASAAARFVTLADLAARLTRTDQGAAAPLAAWGDCELF